MAKKATKSVKKASSTVKASQAKKTSAKSDSKKGAVAAVKAVSSLLFGKGKGKAKTKASASAKADIKVKAKGSQTKSSATATKSASPKDAKKATPAPTKEVAVAVLKKGAQKASGAKAARSSSSHYDDGSERMCRESGCENVATTQGYCRLDYVKNWKRIKRKEMILREGKLDQYIEELVSKYPEKHMDMLRQDLNSEGSFAKVIRDLELDDAIDDSAYDGDAIDNLIGSIRKDADGVEGGGSGDDDF
jgi:hypothetical protein